jgi:hypothetical protein
MTKQRIFFMTLMMYIDSPLYVIEISGIEEI